MRLDRNNLSTKIVQYIKLQFNLIKDDVQLSPSLFSAVQALCVTRNCVDTIFSEQKKLTKDDRQNYRMLTSAFYKPDVVFSNSSFSVCDRAQIFYAMQVAIFESLCDEIKKDDAQYAQWKKNTFELLSKRYNKMAQSDYVTYCSVPNYRKMAILGLYSVYNFFMVALVSLVPIVTYAVTARAGHSIPDALKVFVMFSGLGLAILLSRGSAELLTSASQYSSAFFKSVSQACYSEKVALREALIVSPPKAEASAWDLELVEVPPVGTGLGLGARG